MLMVPTAGQIAALTNVGLLANLCGLSGGAWNARMAEIRCELDDPIRVIAITTDKEAKASVANVRTFKNDSGEDVAVKPAVAGKFRLFFATARHLCGLKSWEDGHRERKMLKTTHAQAMRGI